MIIINNNLVPFGKFDCMNILGILFVKNNTKLPQYIINHEAIHTSQQYEILLLSLFIALIVSNIYASWWYLLISVIMPIFIYVLVWFVELILPPYSSAYKDSPFEREAYLNQTKDSYLTTRPLFAWVKYWLIHR